jgi:hypothetical protein
MKNFIVIFREPDGRTIEHSEEEIKLHQLNWKSWLEKTGSSGKLKGGSGLTLNGNMITQDGVIHNNIHTVGKEIIGGFLLLNCVNLDEATEIVKSCPIFEFDGYAEVRELIN